MPAEPTPARRHFTTIDALRGFAALSVCLFHFGGAVLPKLSSPLTTKLTSWGWTGVEVFFVISGFVIPYVLLRGNYHWRDGGTFLARRFIRIWPPSAILIALTVLQYIVINRSGMGAPAGWTEVSFGRVTVNLAYAVPFTSYTWLNGILWTLAVEFQYYIVLALLFPLLTRHYSWLVAAGALCLVSSLLPFAETILFLHFANYFAMGGVVLLYREARIQRWTMLGVLAIMAAVAVSQIGWLPTLFATVTALVIAFVPIRNRVFVFLGTISYSLYLVHVLVGSTAEFAIVRLFAPGSMIERWVAQIAILGVSILGAWLFYLLVERHFVAWSQKLAAPREVRAIRSAPEVMPPAGL